MPRKFLTPTKLLALLELARETANIDHACEKFGVTRATYFRWKARFEREGPAGLQRKPQLPRASSRQFSTEDRDAVVEFALQRPWMGCHKLAHAYFEAYGRPISGVSIHQILKDHHLETVAKRTNQAARNLIQSPNLRSGELWDFIRQKNPLIDIIGLDKIGRGENLLVALLPYPQVRGFERQPRLERGLPWAFVVIDLSTGYTFGNLRREGDSLNFWSPTIDLVAQTAEALRFIPRSIQIVMASMPLSQAVEEYLAWTFPTSSVQVVPERDAFRSGWISNLYFFLCERWYRSPEYSSSKPERIFVDLLKAFNSEYRNDGFPNFGDPPEQLFWSELRSPTRVPSLDR